jgi:SAM-dependent methyltransferase
MSKKSRREKQRADAPGATPKAAEFSPVEDKSIFSGTEARIAVASFLILFLELLLIRWLPAYILHLAYFSNFVLMASFFGGGLGFLLSERRSFFPLLPLSLLILAAAGLVHLDMSFRSEQELFFQKIAADRTSVPFWLIAPLLFFFVAATFVGPAQLLGTLFRRIPPLAAYTWNIVGSIAGVALFAAFSAIRLGPVVWFAVVVLAYIALRGAEFRRSLLRDAPVFALLFVLLAVLTSGTTWSPYYKLVVKPIGDPAAPRGYAIFANESGHQTAARPEDRAWIYQAPYVFFTHPHYKDVLIIGAGSGTDVALALERGAERIDAVDIDPVIVGIGRKLHPLHPYSDPRVFVTIADGRTFLETTKRKYDLIIFALTDSLALSSTVSNTRLESYLFTEESFQSAQRCLKDGGLLVLYNSYREEWLVTKLAAMMQRVFGYPPYVVAPHTDVLLAAIMAGPKLSDLVPYSKQLAAGIVAELSDTTPQAIPSSETFQSATDEWPFVYLRHPAIPIAYLFVIFVVIALSIGAVVRIQGGVRELRRFPWHFFFLGAGFLLLETKNVVNFQLLFGSTWIVNALVFLAMLGFGLAGVLLASRTTLLRPALAYGALVAILALNIILPLSVFAPLSPAMRYVAAALLTLSPVFFSSLIFAESFKYVARADHCLAANLLGALAGGFSEYSSMLIGYRWLVAVAIAYYLASWATQRSFDRVAERSS